MASPEAINAEVAALGAFAEPVGDRFSELPSIHQPTLVVNGHRDIMIPTINSYIPAQHIPSAQLIIYPDSGHGALFQYHELFVNNASRFLDSEAPLPDRRCVQPDNSKKHRPPAYRLARRGLAAKTSLLEE